MTMILILVLINPASARTSLSPEMEVYDISGKYLGHAPSMKTVSLVNMEECKSLHKVYYEPIQKRVQIQRKLDLANVNILKCKIKLDYIVSNCGYDGGYIYAFGPRTIQINVMQRLDGASCFKLHGGNEIEVTVEGKSDKIKLQEGRTQGKYFI